MRRGLARGLGASGAVLVWLALGCALAGAPAADRTPLRLGELVEGSGPDGATDGPVDPIRRASLDLVLEGLDADASGHPRRASGLYARALQVDSANPWAYLALARHHVASGDPELALRHLARSEDLLRSADALSPRAEVHLEGLRGAALRRLGRGREGDALLARAAARAPSVWGDGALSADELR